MIERALRGSNLRPPWLARQVAQSAFAGHHEALVTKCSEWANTDHGLGRRLIIRGHNLSVVARDLSLFAGLLQHREPQILQLLDRRQRLGLGHFNQRLAAALELR